MILGSLCNVLGLLGMYIHRYIILVYGIMIMFFGFFLFRTGSINGISDFLVFGIFTLIGSLVVGSYSGLLFSFGFLSGLYVDEVVNVYLD